MLRLLEVSLNLPVRSFPVYPQYRLNFQVSVGPDQSIRLRHELDELPELLGANRNVSEFNGVAHFKGLDERLVEKDPPAVFFLAPRALYGTLQIPPPF